MAKVEGKKGSITVRPMVDEDITSVLEIDRKITGKERAVTYRDLVDSYIGGDLGLSCVAESDNTVVGFVMGRLSYSEYPVVESGRIQIIGVDPDYWRQGIGSLLVQGFVDLCRSKGIGLVHVAVNSRDDKLQVFLQGISFARRELVEFWKKI
ncbi:MAG: GNAT family N-acetyltransferase [Dehalococcoidia bacterium]|nr:GNAT family N-acetyltransferase [Dehalococcoidia bacterium]